MEVNRPDVVAEVTVVFERYEQALVDNDLAVLNELFWDDERVVRFGPDETLYGREALRRFRSSRPADDLQRTLTRTTITTFGDSIASIGAEFRRRRSGRRGRQSQTWIRTTDGWRVVAAHVSLDASEAEPSTRPVPSVATTASNNA